MKDQHYYICDYCYVEFIPKRRHVQKYCSNSCRSKAYHQRKQIVVDKKEIIIQDSNEANVKPLEKMTLAGVGNAAAGTLIADGVKSIFTSDKNRIATKGDLEMLTEKLRGRYFLIKNLPVAIDGTHPYYDLINQEVVYH